MSDLISRSELLKALSEAEDNYRAEHHDCVMDDDPFSDGILSAMFSVFQIVKSQPTAYDIGKIVKELEKNASRYTKKYTTPYGNNGYKDTKAISVNRAIEIVKQGCVSVANNVTSRDDVCECRLLKGYNFLHKTSCGDVFEMENGFKFCPYCGKKIKIVGG